MCPEYSPCVYKHIGSLWPEAHSKCTKYRMPEENAQNRADARGGHSKRQMLHSPIATNLDAVF